MCVFDCNLIIIISIFEPNQLEKLEMHSLANQFSTSSQWKRTKQFSIHPIRSFLINSRNYALSNTSIVFLELNFLFVSNSPYRPTLMHLLDKFRLKYISINCLFDIVCTYMSNLIWISCMWCVKQYNHKCN
jgi:hypothetical protein